ncbi:Uncharacterized protein TCAP_05388 [Tolypocladium capitatum]|uniref:Uncharacterized protein n=1 Tax=Tolypocladium capitatum TaxID=45235 RepID=A0A2K3QAU2_9HYPO|nr:Uncharacterized protein TCAP_05388 [Tolypocladium capitatum]
MARKEIHERRAASQPPFPSPTPPRHPPAKAAASARRDAASQFLPISSLLNPHTGLKRRRNRLDVDGPDTAALSSKKRRLRFHPVTSRLSQPYSCPATHIHCGQDAKRTATRPSAALEPANADPQRKSPNLQPTSLLRFSIMNRMRTRLGLKGPAVVKVDRADAGFVGPDAAPQTMWQRQGPEEGPEEKQYAPWTSSATGPGRRTVSKRSEQRHPVKGKPFHQLPKTPSESPAWTALPAPPSSKPATIDRNASSPTHAPLSSESRPPRKTYHLFQDSFAFLHPDGEPLGDVSEESDDVYCDFSVLFGKAQSPSPDPGDGLAPGAVDEHDGLPWMVR